MQLIETHIAYQIQNLQQKAIYKQKIISYFRDNSSGFISLNEVR